MQIKQLVKQKRTKLVLVSVILSCLFAVNWVREPLSHQESDRITERPIFHDRQDSDQNTPLSSVHPQNLDQFSTYFGGSAFDILKDIDIDANGNCYIVGSTQSGDVPMVNSYNATYGVGSDVLIAKFGPMGNLLWSTYLGGLAADAGNGIAVDSAGNCYVTGFTSSTNFPTTIGAFNTTMGALAYDAFVAKFTTSGTLAWSTYLGGPEDETGKAIAVDGAGNCYVTGETSGWFPTTPGAFNQTFSGVAGSTYDTFVSKFGPTGTLLWSTYLGGTNNENGNAIALDSNGNCFISGSTDSNADFPLLNALDSSYAGGTDVYLSKFSTAGSLLWSTYLGGDSYEQSDGLATDLTGNCYVTGRTHSTNFPTTPGAYDRIHNLLHSDVFITKIAANGASLLWSTFLGGSTSEYGYGIDIDAQGNCYVTGHTTSTDFPTQNAFDMSFNGGNNDAFVASFAENGNILWNSLIGGTGIDETYGIAVDATGTCYIAGKTESPNFPILNPFNRTLGGSSEGFIAHILFGENSTTTPGTEYFSTFLGGTNTDEGKAIARDASGNIYVTGHTSSADFPTQGGVLNQTQVGGKDAFIVKFASNGTRLWSAYLGGSSDDEAYGIGVDTSGNCYIVGATDSANFPITMGANDTQFNGTRDGFLVKITPSGTLLWSTFLGGNNSDYGSAIAVNGLGDCYVTGFTNSPDFPITSGANDTTLNGSDDAFVSKFSSTGNLLWSTYLGGNAHDYGHLISIDSNNNCYIAGEVESTDFPTTANAIDTTLNGVSDTYITKFSTTGTLLWSTYIGGNNIDNGWGFAFDTTGDFYFVGNTASDDFVTVNPFDATLNGSGDAFIMKFSQTGTILWSTYLGGSGTTDGANAVAIDSAGDLYIIGNTDSSDFPILNAFDTAHSGGSDIYFTRFSSNHILLQSTYFGASDLDSELGLVLDPMGTCIFTGFTESTQFPVFNAFDSGYNTNRDAFITKVRFADIVPVADMHYYLGSTGNQIEWKMLNLQSNASMYNITRNGISIMNGSWTSVGLINLPVDGLAAGTYVYVINASNGFFSILNDTVTVTVLALPIITSPEDLQFEVGTTGHNVTWTITDISVNSGTYNITRNGTTIFHSNWVSGTAILITVDGLNGHYNFTIIGWDGYGGSVTDTVTVKADNTLPIITHPKNINITALPPSVLSWVPTDISINITKYTLYCNGISIATGNWTSNTLIEITVTNLTEGSSNYTIVLEDGYGGSVSDELWVHVNIPSPPTVSSGLIGSLVGICAGVVILGSVWFIRSRSLMANRLRRIHGKSLHFSLGDFRGRWRRRL